MPVFLLLVACGGGSSAGVNGLPSRIGSSAALDGAVFSNGFVIVHGGTPITGDVDDVEIGVTSRQFFSFDLSALPPGTQVKSAILKLYMTRKKGAPFFNLGWVELDHVDRRRDALE